MKATRTCVVSVSIGLLCSCMFSECHAEENVIKVYQAGGQVRQPQLLPIDFSASIAAACDEHQSLTIQVAMIVDPNGKPQSLMVSQPSGDDRDELAIEIASRDSFEPGEKDGVPVAVSITLDISLNSCIVKDRTANGEQAGRYRLLSQPEQKIGPAARWEPEKLASDKSSIPVGMFRIGNGVKPPVAIFTPEAPFTDEARRKGIQGVCLIGLLVDEHGIPKNVRIVRPLGYGLDTVAMEAARRYRFKPAMLDGFRPVPVMMTIEVNFRDPHRVAPLPDGSTQP